MARKRRIFISYSRKDAALVDALCGVLPQDVAEVFVDRTGIHGADDFVNRIAEEIGRSDLVVFIAGKNSYESRYVQKELLYALDRGIPVLPLIVDTTPMPDAISFLLGDINQISIREHPIDANLGQEIILAASGITKKSSASGKKKKVAGFASGIVIAVLAIAALVYFSVVRQVDKVASQQMQYVTELTDSVLTYTKRAFHIADSLKGLNNPEAHAAQEIDILIDADKEIQRMSSALKQETPPLALPDVIVERQMEIAGRLDSIYNVWIGQARIAMSLYKKTRLEQERGFAEEYLQLAGRIKKDSEWERLHNDL